MRPDSGALLVLLSRPFPDRGNISIAVSGMQILFIGSHVTGWLADSLLADLSLPCSLLRKTRFSSEHEQGLSTRSPNQDGGFSIALKFQNESEFVAAEFLLFPWTETCESHHRRRLIWYTFFFPPSLSLWEQLWITRIHRESLFKSVRPNLKVTKEEHLKMRCVIGMLAQSLEIKNETVFWFVFFKGKGHNPSYRKEKQLKWII